MSGPRERKNHIAAEWAIYAERVMPEHPSPVQVQETRRAFYAGGYAMINRLLRHVSDEPEMTDEDEAIFGDVEAEMTEHVLLIQEGKR